VGWAINGHGGLDEWTVDVLGIRKTRLDTSIAGLDRRKKVSSRSHLVREIIVAPHFAACCCVENTSS
jgi:hypothetical protein